MEMKLSKNIRKFRRERGFTQERLAELLNVSVGAVYKWESGRSAPEIEILIELADLFEISVDVLLGYKIRSNDRNHIIVRLEDYIYSAERQNNEKAAEEAERALKKYPNDFKIVYNAAMLYFVKGWEKRDDRMLRRALELYGHACILIGQNTDERISELSIKTEMATIYSGLNEWEKAVGLLKGNNPLGVNSPLIGYFLAVNKRADEAAQYLSQALINVLTAQCEIVMGYLNFYREKEDTEQSLLILDYILRSYKALEYPDRRCFLHKEEAMFLAVRANIFMKMNDRKSAKEALKEAKRTADWFDAEPAYGIENIRFLDIGKNGTAYDSIGETAVDGIRKVLADAKNGGLNDIWEEILNEKE